MASPTERNAGAGVTGPQRGRWAVGLGVLAGLTWLTWLTWLLHRAPGQGWVYDDGAHLDFAVRFGPLEYFLQPAVMRIQSYANLTPWNALFYDINLALFGMAPAGHYAHLLAVVALTAGATVLLLRLWQPRWVALLAALLFLLGLPTAHVARELMTGHYATGLLWSVLCLHGFVLAGRTGQRRYQLWAALCYAAAALCKEVYVPLPLVLLLLASGGWRDRLRQTLPFFALALLYVGWRYLVLGRLMGGYVFPQVDASQRLVQLAELPWLLAGGLPGQWAVRPAVWLAAVVAVLLLALWQRRVVLPLLLVGAGVVLLPLLPLTQFPGIHSPDRYLFLPWWAASVWLALALRGPVESRAGAMRLPAVALVVVLLGGLALAQRGEISQQLGPRLAEQSRMYAAALQLDSHTVLLPPPDRAYHRDVLQAARNAQAALAGQAADAAPRMVATTTALCVAWQAGQTVLQLSPVDGSLQNITASVPAVARDLSPPPPNQRAGVPLSVRFTFGDKLLRWQLGPHAAGRYTVKINGAALAAPREGGVTHSARDRFAFVLQYQDPEGWTATSPPIEVDPAARHDFVWSGLSVLPSPQGCATPVFLPEQQ